MITLTLDNRYDAARLIKEMADLETGKDQPEPHALQAIYGSRTKFQSVSCSQCGQSFGPGDHGFSHCKNHEHLKPVRWNAPTKGGI